ncbi:hypothetical protein DFH07DRAFT_811424 [Mycena maculata]|uniref:DUF6533 domain-containing protein n=1 Tax=Mycena maculata TaxID=230809 RepID=A0AAD7NK48_9AGAR|nr:hypothetical protein DFH07DRAFT_811424 [Mycena maculata]
MSLRLFPRTSSNLSMSDAADFAKFLHVINAAQIYIACTTSILIWDWLSCLPQEWRCIWKSKASPIKILYCVIRYYTLLVLVVTDVWFFASWNESSCARYVRVLPGIAVLIDLCVELVLALRIYALYGYDRRIGVFLAVFVAGFLGVMVAVPILGFDYTRLPSWPGPCIVTGKPSIAGPKFIIAFYASPMTFDMVMTAMTVHRVLDHNRHGASSSLMNRMVRDGLFYFFAITSLNLLNVIFFVQGNELIQAINAPMSIQISSVLCCRLILNLRVENDARLSVKKFSNTRGRWVTDIIHDNSVAREVLHFSPRSGERNLPAAESNPQLQSITGDGIVIHFEEEAHDDNWKIVEESSVV